MNKRPPKNTLEPRQSLVRSPFHVKPWCGISFSSRMLCSAFFSTLFASINALALDFSAVTTPTVLYDAPSAKATPLFVIYPGTPVERVINVDGWVKVRDSQGTLAWIEKKYLGSSRQLIVTAQRAQIRTAAEDLAPLAFEAERDVILTLIPASPETTPASPSTSTAPSVALKPTAAPKGGPTVVSNIKATDWIKVKHRDGQQGFIKSNQVWGW